MLQNLKLKIIDKDSDKYKVLLKLVNKILTNLNKAEVDDLTKFIHINREDIIKDINKDSLVAMENELFPLFDKRKSGYYRKTDGLVINCLRGLLKEAGYEFRPYRKEKSVRINDKSYKQAYFVYSIK